MCCFMNSFEALSWHALIIFRIYVIEIKLDSVSYNRDKNLQRRRRLICWRTWLSHTKLLYWSSSMSESQQGPEICDVINAKPIRFMLHLYAFIINRFVIFKELRSSKPFHNEPFDPPCIIIHYSDLFKTTLQHQLWHIIMNCQLVFLHVLAYSGAYSNCK